MVCAWVVGLLILEYLRGFSAFNLLIKMRESKMPNWLGMYEGLINVLRCPLRRFEDKKLDFWQFVDETNEILSRHGLNRVKVEISKRKGLRRWWYGWYKRGKNTIIH